MTIRSTLKRAVSVGTVAAAALAAQATLAPAPASAVPSKAACASIIQIVARGSTEPAGPAIAGNVYTSGGLGIMSSLAGAVQSRSAKSVRTVGLAYPARLDALYSWSQTTGSATLARELNRLAKACPSSRTVLIGYSQGAHVVGDTTAAANRYGLSAAAKSRIAAVFFTGDPVRRYGEPFNRGSGVGGGMLPNRGAGQLSGLGSRIVSYCYRGDWACDPARMTSLSSGQSIHRSYGNASIRDYGAAFVLSKTA